MLAVAVFSVFSVNEFYSWQRARWTAFFDLRREGIALAEIQAGVLEEVRKWAGEELEDDMTLLMVRAIEADAAREA